MAGGNNKVWAPEDGVGVVREPVKLLMGTHIDYYSKSQKDWLPAVITRVCEESGAVHIDVKPKKLFHIQEQKNSIRARTKPSREKLEWVRTVLRDGLVEEESNKLFNDHARGNPPMLTQENAPAIAAALDRKFGVTGNILAINHLFGMCQDADNVWHELASDRVGHDAFLQVVWDLMWSVHKCYGHSLLPKTCVRHEDPREAYEFVRSVGSGTYGEVYICKCKRSGASKAIKKMEKDPYMKMEEVDPEIQHLRTLDHPHIVRLYEYFDFGRDVFLVVDWCSGGDLEGAIKRSRPHGLRHDFVSEVMQQVLLAIAHVHARGVVHLDLKGANIMLMPSKGTLPPSKHDVAGHTLAAPHERPHVMVIDLGVAQMFRPGNYRNNQPVGTPATMAPEVWFGVVTPKADIWSLGVVIFEMFTTHLPFRCGADYEASRSYWRTKPRPQWNLMHQAPDCAVKLCQAMLAHEKDQRPSASDCLRSYTFVQPPSAQEPIKMPNVPPHILQRLLEGPRRSVLHRSVALAIARRWSSNHNPTVKNLFNQLDKNSTGRLEKDMLSCLFTRLNATEETAMESADCMDLSRDGRVDWTEFVAACMDLSDERLDDDLRRIFKEADCDGDELLGFDDLSSLLLVSGADEVQEVLKEVVGRGEKGAKIDWKTFRKQFRNGSESSFAEDVAVEISNGQQPQPACGYQMGRSVGRTQAPAAAEFGFLQQAQAQARVLFEQAGEVIFQTPTPQAQPEPTAAIHPNQFYIYEDNLRKLKEMGLDNKEKNIAVLHRHKNQLSERAITEILATA